MAGGPESACRHVKLDPHSVLKSRSGIRKDFGEEGNLTWILKYIESGQMKSDVTERLSRNGDYIAKA